MQINIIYFSPTGNTKQSAINLSKGFSIKANFFNITTVGIDREFTPSELTIFAVPVFAGRIPLPMYDRLKTISGTGPAALLVTYGNRAYDDALLELKDQVMLCGFTVVAGMALVTRHSIVTSLAATRPDRTDEAIAKEYAAQIEKKVKLKILSEIIVKGNRPYIPRHDLSVLTPIFIKSKCKNCALCYSLCPTGAIEFGKPGSVNKRKCVQCMLCVNRCKQNARKVRCLPMFLTKRKLAKHTSYKKPEIFI